MMGSPTRKKIILLLAGRKSPVEPAALSKLGHIVEPVCTRTLDELVEKGLVARVDEGYVLTEDGFAVHTSLLST